MNVGSVSATTGTAATPATQDDEKLKKAAKGFEAVFVRQLLKEARASSFSDDDMTNNSAVEQFQEMQDAKTADTMADRGTFGIATSLIKQLGPKQAAAAYAAPATNGAAK
jgi:flagellar protein FlgJ